MPRNLLSIFSGQLLTWASSAIFFLVIPRYLGAEGTGIVSIGATYAGVVLAVGGLGMATLITRDVARSTEETGKWLLMGMLVQGALAIAVAIVAVSVAYLSGASAGALVAVTVFCLAAPALLVSLTVISVLQGLERMPIAAVYDVLTKLAGLVLVLVVIAMDGGLYPVIIAMNGATFVVAAVHFVHLRRLLPLRWPGFSFGEAFSLIRLSIPFFMITVFFMLYTSTDIIALSILAEERDAGIYSVPSRLFGTMLFVPAAIATVVFPRLSSSAQGDRSAFDRLSTMSLLYAATASGGMMLGAAAMSDEAIVALLGSSFTQTGPVILAFSASLVPTAISTIAGRIAFATDRQRTISIIGACAFVGNLVLAIIAIPLFDARWGNAALGAALGFVVAEGFMVSAMLWLLPRRLWTRDFVRRGVAFVAALALGTLIVLVLIPLTGGWIAAGVSMSVYAVCLLAFGVHSPGELVAFVRRIFERNRVPALSQ